MLAVIGSQHLGENLNFVLHSQSKIHKIFKIVYAKALDNHKILWYRIYVIIFVRGVPEASQSLSIRDVRIVLSWLGAFCAHFQEFCV